MRILATACLTLGLGLFAVPVSAGVSPGDVITPQSADKLKDGTLPDSIVPYMIDGNDKLNIRIVPTQEYPTHPKYVEATVKYACQTSLRENGTLANYTAGQPFPYSEWAKKATNHACDLTEDDPQFALKLAWNINYRWQGGSGINLPHWGFSWARNSGKEVWRIGQGEYRRTYFSGRSDLLPERHQLDPGTNVEWAEFFDVKDPFDLRGTMFLLYRYMDGKEDDTWAYIPALRRVRRIAATQKSDSLLGSEFALEDFYLFSGYVWDHKWEFKGESDIIAVMDSDRECFPAMFEDNGAHSFSRLGNDEEFWACSFAPYGVMSFAEETYEVRRMFRIDDIPMQKGHPYSRKALWYDKETLMPHYALAYDRSGKPYKLLMHVLNWSEDSGLGGDKGKFVNNIHSVAIVNLQNLNTHISQFYTANAFVFEVDESKRYYDTTKLKRRGR